MLRVNVARPISHKLGNVKAGRLLSTLALRRDVDHTQRTDYAYGDPACACLSFAAVWSQDEWFKNQLKDDQDLADQMEFDSTVLKPAQQEAAMQPANKK